jgi:hypothetical protein
MVVNSSPTTPRPLLGKLEFLALAEESLTRRSIRYHPERRLRLWVHQTFAHGIPDRERDWFESRQRRIRVGEECQSFQDNVVVGISGPRTPISKRVIIEDRKADRDPMFPAFHVNGDLRDIPHPALYPGKSRWPRWVNGVRRLQFETCMGLDATFPERVIVGNEDYLIRRVAKAQFAELLSGDILSEYGLEKATRKYGRQPKETRSNSGAHLVPPLKDQALLKCAT